jgi:hypothetical protein
MDAPQSPVEIAPIEQALRLLDDQLRIVWNPMCVASRPGYIDVHGKVSPPVYDGRWEIVRLQGHIDPNPVVVWIWGTELGPARPYRAVDYSLVEFMRQWDTSNREVINAHLAIREAEEREREQQRANAQEGVIETLHRAATDKLHGRELWHVPVQLISS